MPSKGHIIIPGEIVGKPVLVRTDIVESNIPLLFSRDSLKSMKAKVDYETDKAVILDQPVLLTKTSVGHHCISLLTETVEVNVAITLSQLNEKKSLTLSFSCIVNMNILVRIPLSDI